MSPPMPSVAVYDVSDPHHNEGNAFGLDASHPKDTFNPAQAYVLTLGAGQSRNKVVGFSTLLPKSSGTLHSTNAPGRR